MTWQETHSRNACYKDTEPEQVRRRSQGEIVKYYNQRFLVTLSASVPRILTDWGRGPVLIVLLNKQQHVVQDRKKGPRVTSAHHVSH